MAPTGHIPGFFGQRLPRREFFHYTSQQGLIGIVGGKSLWATNIEYLNDTSEFIHGDGFMNQTILERRNMKKTGESSFFEWLDGIPETFKSEDIYVTSLSENGDLLSQWRGYTPTSCGFSVGFEPRCLRQFAWTAHHAILGRCVYTDKDKKNLAERILNYSLNQWSLSKSGFVEPRIAVEFRTRSKFAAALMKDPAFNEEREWRLLKVCGEKGKIKFRSGTSAIVPYIELDWGDVEPKIYPISSVVLGACPHPELSEKSVNRLLENYNPPRGPHDSPHALARKSKIPFRSW